MTEPTMKSIPGYEGRYSATFDGFVYSHITNRILKGYKINSGYLVVTLQDNIGIKKKFLVHRIVCSVFHGEKPASFDVNHINFDRTDNNPNNLEWTTRRENLMHSHKNGRYDSLIRSQSKPVYAIAKNGEKKYYESMHAAERAGFDESNISNCIRGKLKTYKGYRWVLAQ